MTKSPTSSPIVLTYRKETNINSASRPAKPPSIKELTNSVNPNTGSIPVGYSILAKTKKTKQNKGKAHKQQTSKKRQEKLSKTPEY